MYARFARSDVSIQIAHSKEAVMSTVRKLQTKRRDPKVFGIVDSDLDAVMGKHHDPPIFATDLRDMEMMAIVSPALDSVLIEYGQKDRLERFERDNGRFLDSVIDACYGIGVLMALSVDRRWGLSFRDLDMERFVDPRSLRMSTKGLVREVFYNSGPNRLDQKDVLALLEARLDAVKDRKPYVRGHDAVKAILLALKSSVGSPSAQRIGPAAIESALRLSYRPDFFEATRLRSDSAEWAAGSGFEIWIALGRNPRP